VAKRRLGDFALHTVIAAPARCDAPPQSRSQIDKGVAIDVAQQEITVIGVLQPEQLSEKVDMLPAQSMLITANGSTPLPDTLVEREDHPNSSGISGPRKKDGVCSTSPLKRYRGRPVKFVPDLCSKIYSGIIHPEIKWYAFDAKRQTKKSSTIRLCNCTDHQFLVVVGNLITQGCAEI
jgi:hypothetical protein